MLGDIEYVLKRWLMTPYTNPTTASERRFNELHRKTRCVIEQSFGVIRSRWLISDHTEGRQPLLHSSQICQNNYHLLYAAQYLLTLWNPFGRLLQTENLDFNKQKIRTIQYFRLVKKTIVLSSRRIQSRA